MSPRRLPPRLLLPPSMFPLTAAAPAPIPKRIVSLDMCVGQMPIALADRVAALTEWSQDPSLSYQAGRAAAYRTARRMAKELIALDPDLIVGASF